MLQSLHIQNFALIEDLHIVFAEGVTIFTGETGAGKSILLDAIGMLAGKRASAEFVRQGTDSFLVEGAFFFTGNPALEKILEANHIAYDENQVVISRQFNLNGRGSILINGTLVSTAVMRHIGEQLLDIHGQFDNRLIFDPSYHISLLDGLTPQLRTVREKYDTAYRNWKLLRQQIQQMRHDEAEKKHMLSILDFQIKEIEEAKLKSGEDNELEDKINRLSHAEKIKNSLRDILILFDGSERRPGIMQQMGEMKHLFSHAAAYDTIFKNMGDKTETITYEMEDIHDELLQYAEAFTFDEQELDVMQSRLALIEKLKRKYGSTIDEIMSFLKRAKDEYERLDQSEYTLNVLQKKNVVLEQSLRETAGQLQRMREAANSTFRTAMQKTLAQLGLENARISFHVEPMDQISAQGAALVELYFSANKGEPLQPLSKIASGGEVSRIALALKTISADMVKERTLIFDEIDVGISGQVGLEVAAHIRKLSCAAQVLCITHLPQTAAIADHHYFLYKKEIQNRTVTQIKQLSPGEHVLEIARMFSGNDTTKVSIEAAKQLIEQVH